MKKLNLIIAALVVAAVPVSAQTQPTPVTKADVQNVIKIIGGDKAKTQAYCDIGKLGDQMEQANARRTLRKFEELSLKADELGKQLGPEWAAVDGRNSGRGPQIRGRSGYQVDDARPRQGVHKVANGEATAPT